MSKKLLLKIVSIFFIVISVPFGLVSAQQQSAGFSGNNPESYSCYNRQGDRVDLQPIKDEARGIFYCNVNPLSGYQACEDGIYDDGEACDPMAVLNPPTLQQLEVWFVRIVYAIWAIAGTFSFFGIVIIGYQYMISRGAPEATVKVKDRIAKFIIGFCLVFLAVPILNTVFRLLSVNDSVQCYQGLTSNVGVGFQFFFPELCTDPNNQVVETDPCSRTDASGLLCQDEGSISDTCIIGTVRLYYQCLNSTWTPVYITSPTPSR